MCIIIFKPIGTTLTKQQLEICANNNRDGCGFAYAENNSIKIFKTLDFEEFWKRYDKVQSTIGKDLNIIIHFRIATHGGVSPENCHPFKLNKRMVLAHNGIINGYGDKKDKVDTLDFIDKVIGNISWKQWRNSSFRQLVGDAIGYSKFAILDTSGDAYLINAHKGEWVDGIWYSNTSYKERKVTKLTYTYSDNYNDYYDYYDKYLSFNKDRFKLKKDTKKNETKVCNETYTLPPCTDDPCPLYECKKCGTLFAGTYYDDYGTPCPICEGKEYNEVGFRYDQRNYDLDGNNYKVTVKN